MLFFFFPFVLSELFLDLSLQGLWEGLDPLPNDKTLQRIDVYIPDVCAAVSAAYFADGVLLIRMGIAFKALIDVLQRLLFFFPGHLGSASDRPSDIGLHGDRCPHVRHIHFSLGNLVL